MPLKVELSWQIGVIPCIQTDYSLILLEGTKYSFASIVQNRSTGYLCKDQNRDTRIASLSGSTPVSCY